MPDFDQLDGFRDIKGERRDEYVFPAFLPSALCLINATAWNQEELPLTIEKAIQIGLENSKTLDSSFMKVEYADVGATLRVVLNGDV